MTKEELKAKMEKRKERMGNEETQKARHKLFMGQALSQKESQLLFEYLLKLENYLDKVNEE